MVAPRNVPIHPLSDYGTEMSAGQQFFIGRFEHSISNKPNRLRLHRHTYYEVFCVDGRGSFFANWAAKLRAKAASDLQTTRVGLPGDAAKSYLYAIQNSYVTGQTIIVDGGGSLT
jgi:hypothetical protein